MLYVIKYWRKNRIHLSIVKSRNNKKKMNIIFFILNYANIVLAVSWRFISYFLIAINIISHNRLSPINDQTYVLVLINVFFKLSIFFRNTYFLKIFLWLYVYKSIVFIRSRQRRLSNDFIRRSCLLAVMWTIGKPGQCGRQTTNHPKHTTTCRCVIGRRR